MCGRFSILVTPKRLKERYLVSEIDPDLFQPFYNATPGMFLPVVIGLDSPRIFLALWGLVPTWATGSSKGSKLINARVETIQQKQSFRDLIYKNRCIIPTNGFFEWTSPQKGHIPHLFRIRGGGIFSLAGIWKERIDTETGKTIRTFTIITTEANSVVKPVHDRMPCIIHPDDELKWLSGKLEVARLEEPCNGDDMEGYSVSSLINSPKVNDPSVLLPHCYNI